MKSKTKREPVKIYGRGAAKPESKRGPAFVFSSDLQEAAYSLWGNSSETSVTNAMKDPKSRQLLRAEQLRLALIKKHGPAHEAPVSEDADDPPAA
jgi:hypothetical protein